MKKNLLALLVVTSMNSYAQNSTDISRFVKIDETVYVSKYEVTNAEFQNFIKEQKSSKFAPIDSLLDNSSRWDFNPSGMGLHSFYSTNDVTKEYPVLNISFEAAQAFCEWLTSKYQNTTLPGHTVKYRLMGRKEWIKVSSREGEPVGYPLVNVNTRQALCNYFEIPQKWIAWNNGKLVISSEMLTIEEVYPKKVGSYPVTKLGLYNLFGNAAEMLNEKVVVGGSWFSTGSEIVSNSEMPFDGKPSPYVGFRVVVETIK